MAVLGGWDISEMKVTNLPQKVCSAFTVVTGELTGADYQPVLYVGKQIVNGTNYCVLAIQRLVVHNPEQRLVKMIINVDSSGKTSLVSISGIAL